MFKIRGSIGEIGDDSAGKRFAYMTEWSVVGPFTVSTDNTASPFTGYQESGIAMPDLRWATVSKKNIGFDYAILGGMFAGSFDWFRDDRYDIFISGSNRSVPSYYGALTTPDINKGKMKNSGFEVEVRFNKVLKNGMRFWANTNYTYAHNKIKLKDDPALYPAYRKAQGYSQGQYTEFIDNGFTRCSSATTISLTSMVTASLTRQTTGLLTVIQAPLNTPTMPPSAGSGRVGACLPSYMV